MMFIWNTQNAPFFNSNSIKTTNVGFSLYSDLILTVLRISNIGRQGV